MKMNNLSNPSRVILSNPARVILSVAKDLAIAASLFAFAACSDYLEDFQDKYDDGKAFAEISSDSDNGDDDGSSDSKLSSSNGGDSELSSSSKGNGDAESSDSTDSSSSATDPGSSSSVAESSSSAFEPCSGTVIYDAEEDPERNKFGQILAVLGNLSSISSDKKTVFLSPEGVITMPLVELRTSDSMNIKPWGGFCIEYTSSGDLRTHIVRSDESFLYKGMPNTNGEKSSFRWSWKENKSLMEEQNDNGRSEGFSIEKVKLISFTTLSEHNSITIHKITTLDSVNPGPILELVTECNGKETIYEKDGKASTNYNTYFSDIKGHHAQFVSYEDALCIEIQDNNPYSYSYAADISDASEINNWGGICIEYGSDFPTLFSVEKYNALDDKFDESYKASIVLPRTKDAYNAFKISWDSFSKFDETKFNPGNLNTIKFSRKIEGEDTFLFIKKITSYN